MLCLSKGRWEKIPSLTCVFMSPTFPPLRSFLSQLTRNLYNPSERYGPLQDFILLACILGLVKLPSGSSVRCWYSAINVCKDLCFLQLNSLYQQFTSEQARMASVMSNFRISVSASCQTDPSMRCFPSPIRHPWKQRLPKPSAHRHFSWQKQVEEGWALSVYFLFCIPSIANIL